MSSLKKGNKYFTVIWAALVCGLENSQKSVWVYYFRSRDYAKMSDERRKKNTGVRNMMQVMISIVLKVDKHVT